LWAHGKSIVQICIGTRAKVASVRGLRTISILAACRQWLSPRLNTLAFSALQAVIEARLDAVAAVKVG